MRRLQHVGKTKERLPSLKAGLPHDLMDGRDCLPSTTGRTTIQQQHAEGARCGTGKDGTPSSHPSGLGAALQQQRDFMSPCIGQRCDELCRLTLPPPANFGGMDHQTCATILSLLRVRGRWLPSCGVPPPERHGRGLQLLAWPSRPS